MQLENLQPKVPTMEQVVMSMFPGVFRNLWIQRSKYSLCLTLFPSDPRFGYQILTRKEIYHGFGQETNLRDVTDMITSYLGK